MPVCVCACVFNSCFQCVIFIFDVWLCVCVCVCVYVCVCVCFRSLLDYVAVINWVARCLSWPCPIFFYNCLCPVCWGIWICESVWMRGWENESACIKEKKILCECLYCVCVCVCVCVLSLNSAIKTEMIKFWAKWNPNHTHTHTHTQGGGMDVVRSERKCLFWQESWLNRFWGFGSVSILLSSIKNKTRNISVFITISFGLIVSITALSLVQWITKMLLFAELFYLLYFFKHYVPNTSVLKMFVESNVS